MGNLLSSIRTALQTVYPFREANAIARIILQEEFGLTLSDVYSGKDIQISEEQNRNLKNIIERLQNYEPLQYVLGVADFCGLRFDVNPDVLIPRPETAELLEMIFLHFSSSPMDILDVGSGSGCIAITLAHRWPNSSVVSWDVSEKALQVARSNNQKLGTNVRFEQYDVLQEEDCGHAKFDLIVSNPPYIKEKERKKMEANVLDWEPDLALFVPDEDPLLFYRAIIQKAIRLLKSHGWLFFEINREHGEEIVSLLEKYGFLQIELTKDLSGNDRFIKAQLAVSSDSKIER